MWVENGAEYDNYYYGLPNNPKLLARSNPEPWEPLPSYQSKFDGTFEIQPKILFFLVERCHPLRERLKGGLRSKIRAVLATMEPLKWISVDYLRVGYKKVEKDNPVVILVTVEKDVITAEEAKRIADALCAECRKVRLDDVEVEIMEGEREGFQGEEEEEEEEQEGDDYSSGAGPEFMPGPTEYPLAGSSIGRSGKSWSGTLGGYVAVGDRIMGITNHHVVFGTSRVVAFPTKVEESDGNSYVMVQPSQADINRRTKNLQHRIRIVTRDVARLQGTRHSEAEGRLSALTTALEELNTWTPERSVVGKVWKTSGRRARERPKDSKEPEDRCFGLDWALIELENPNRFTAGQKFVNELPTYYMENTCNEWYVNKAMRISGHKGWTTDDMPLFLKRALTFEEFLNRKDTAEKSDNKYVMWKFGRSTHYTYAVASHIESDYLSPDGRVSDEYVVKDCYTQNNRRTFSERGDSGSLVWDSDGYVCGLLWRGKDNSPVHYMTLIEYVLDDIRRVCGVDDVRLVLRKDDETSAPQT